MTDKSTQRSFVRVWREAKEANRKSRGEVYSSLAGAVGLLIAFLGIVFSTFSKEAVYAFSSFFLATGVIVVSQEVYRKREAARTREATAIRGLLPFETRETLLNHTALESHTSMLGEQSAAPATSAENTIDTIITAPAPPPVDPSRAQSAGAPV